MTRTNTIYGPAVILFSVGWLAACGREGTSTHEIAPTAPTPTVAAAPPSAPVSPPPPSADEIAMRALSEVGAQQGDRGNTLRFASATFASGGTAFAPADASRIDRVASVLRDNPEMHALIEGFTDSRGTEQINETISEQRAESVRQALVARGVDEARLRTRGAGEANPIADNATATGREQNRRVEIVFSNAQGRFAAAGDAPPTG